MDQEDKHQTQQPEEDQAAPEMPEAVPDPTAELEAERDELKDRMLRMAAELDNFKKRTEREKAEFLSRANETLLRDLLPVVDNLERAMEAAGQSGGDEALVRGLELTLAELGKLLERQGVERVPALGQPFDPEVHEAMMQQEDPDAEDGTVLHVAQEGYLYKGRLLRPAMVVVSKRPPDAEAEDDSVPDTGDSIKITVN